MSFLKNRVSQSIIICILFLGAFLLYLKGVERHPLLSPALKFYHADGFKETLLHSEPVEVNELVVLSYTHSSDGTPVRQFFIVSDDFELQLYEERYCWYGAGLEFGSGYNISYVNGWVSVTGYDRTFHSLPIRVASTVSQYINIGSTEIKLSDLAPPGSSILIKIE